VKLPAPVIVQLPPDAALKQPPVTIRLPIVSVTSNCPPFTLVPLNTLPASLMLTAAVSAIWWLAPNVTLPPAAIVKSPPTAFTPLLAKWSTPPLTVVGPPYVLAAVPVKYNVPPPVLVRARFPVIAPA